jgi:hypothetical protein
MSIAGVLVRFVLAYVLLMVAAGVVMNLLGIKSNSGVNVGILIGATLWPCMAFGQKNGRYFTPSEKTVVVLGMIAIDLALQLVVLLAMGGKMNSKVLLGALAFVGALHAIGIYVVVGWGSRMLEKQQAKAAAAAE